MRRRVESAGEYEGGSAITSIVVTGPCKCDGYMSDLGDGGFSKIPANILTMLGQVCAEVDMRSVQAFEEGQTEIGVLMRSMVTLSKTWPQGVNLVALKLTISFLCIVSVLGEGFDVLHPHRDIHRGSRRCIAVLRYFYCDRVRRAGFVMEHRLEHVDGSTPRLPMLQGIRPFEK